MCSHNANRNRLLRTAWVLFALLPACASEPSSESGCNEQSSGTCGCNPGYEGASCDRCADGYVRDGDTCVAGTCVVASDCNDGNACNGVESCVEHACVSGEPIDCGLDGTCRTTDGTCACATGWAGEDCASCDSGYLELDGKCVAGECTTHESCSDGDPCNGEETCGADRQCDPGTPVDCGPHGSCNEAGACACDTGYGAATCDTCTDGYVRVQDQCLPGTCATDLACSDGKVCNGQESCSTQNTCSIGTPVSCGPNAHCQEPSGTCGCDGGYELVGGSCVAIVCEVPQAPTLSILHAGATLLWSAPGQPLLQVGIGAAGSTAPEAWLDVASMTLPTDGVPYDLRAFARVNDPSCASAPVFSFLYRVHERYPSAVGEPDTDAVPMDDPRIVGWATGWVDPVSYGSDLDDAWKAPERAVGAASGTTLDVVSLGRGGSIVMTFEQPIADGPGPDFAVFENGFNDTFLELAYVEVSSNGEDFVRFDNAYLGDGSVGGFSTHEAHQIGSLAGKYRSGHGTPFDLAVFVNRPEVRYGVLDTSAIRYVRIVDVVGDGSALDSFGNTIFDPYPTVGSAGFDLDAIAVLNVE